MNLKNYKAHLMDVKGEIKITQRLQLLLVHSQDSSLLFHPHIYPFQKSPEKVYHMAWNNNAIQNS